MPSAASGSKASAARPRPDSLEPDQAARQAGHGDRQLPQPNWPARAAQDDHGSAAKAGIKASGAPRHPEEGKGLSPPDTGPANVGGPFSDGATWDWTLMVPTVCFSFLLICDHRRPWALTSHMISRTNQSSFLQRLTEGLATPNWPAAKLFAYRFAPGHFVPHSLCLDLTLSAGDTRLPAVWLLDWCCARRRHVPQLYCCVRRAVSKQAPATRSVAGPGSAEDGLRAGGRVTCNMARRCWKTAAPGWS